jgi:predicted acetyltransferase
MELQWPSVAALPRYVDALDRGWSPDNVSPERAAREHREYIARDPQGFVASQVDRDAAGAPIILPDGSAVQRLPGYVRWLWDGDFCGVINFRWQRGTSALPPTCPGHVGYTVVPWKRRRGYATLALQLLLPEAGAEGLEYLEITADPDNAASCKVITANGGVLVERFAKESAYGGGDSLRFRIPLR